MPDIHPVQTTSQSPAAPCPYCGAFRVGGYEGCLSLFYEHNALAYQNALFFACHRKVVDCYALQHPEYYCVSAKSYAAHLTSLCIAMEHSREHQLHEAVQRWLNGKIDLEKPEVLSSRGNLTITHLQNIEDVSEYKRRVQEWAESVWEAYAEQHDLARAYLRLAQE